MDKTRQTHVMHPSKVDLHNSDLFSQELQVLFDIVQVLFRRREFLREEQDGFSERVHEHGVGL